MLLVSGSLLIGAGSGSELECTKIRVPETTNLAQTVLGKTVEPPQRTSQAFQTMIQTVHIPEGFKPVGAGDNFVVVCK